MKTILALIGGAFAAGADFVYNYNTGNGADWKNIKVYNKDSNGNDLTTIKAINYCDPASSPEGMFNQSPIDLRNDWPVKSAGYDNFQKMYVNPKAKAGANPTDPKIPVKIEWLTYTSQVSLLQDTTGFPESADGKALSANPFQTFNSYHAYNTYGADTRFNGVQFHFHHKSEHTIEGQYFDLEMHTVHYPDSGPSGKNGFIAAAFGIIFDVNNPTRSFSDLEAWEAKIINDFFDSLDWDNTSTDQTAQEIAYGKLHMMVDTDNRYTYRGSVTTPPCAQNVYWNVLKTVYPIQQKHLNQFKSQLRYRGGDNQCDYGNANFNTNNVMPSGACVPGNNREIQAEVPAHNPFIISDGNAGSNIRKPTAYASGIYDQNSILMAEDKLRGIKENAVMAAQAAVPEPVTEESSDYLTTVITVLLIIAILFLLLAVIIVTRNSFNKPAQYVAEREGVAAN